MKVFSSNSLEQTKTFAQQWLAELIKSKQKDNESSGAAVIGLQGHLGAGKTAFTKIIANELGIKEIVTSPTFVIMKIYEPNNGPWKRLIHIDAYRLERMEELQAIEYEKIVSDNQNLILIEWPDNVGLDNFSSNCLLNFELKDDVHYITIV